MRKIFSILTVSVLSLALVACGGGDGSAFGTPGTNPNGGNPAAVAAVTVTASSSTMAADGASSVNISAMVRDASNALLSGVVVTFQASSGGIAVVEGTTDSSGVAKATLTPAGDSTPRTITVTATANGVSGTTTVAVTAPPPAPTASDMTLITSTPSITSSGATTANITAIVRNSSNQFLAGVPVQFSSSSGGINVTQGTTDADGTAKAVLSAAGDPTNRRITVTAVSGAVTKTVDVDVTGTTLVLQGPTSLAVGQTATYTVILANSNAQGIPTRPVTLQSVAGNTLSAATVTTNSTGQATFTVTVVNSGAETLRVSALGLTTPLAINVNPDSFQFTTPNPSAELAIGTPQTVTVNWSKLGVPQAGQTVTFSSTRGTFTPANGQATVDASGNATITLNSTNAGFGTITAQSVGGTAQLPVEFVATTPFSVEAQSSNFTIGPTETATLTAVVRDQKGNLVKNKTVTFNLTDVTGGTLSAGTGVTDSNGRAQTTYTANAGTSAQNGVIINVGVQGAPAVTDQVALTVARREVFISMGTGNELAEPNSAQYSVEYVIQVTDASGNGVPNVPISVSVLSQRYYKGFRAVVGTAWKTCYTTVRSPELPSVPGGACNNNAAGGCADEDSNRNGLLDSEPYVDTNANGQYDGGEPFNDKDGDGVRDREEDNNDSNRIEAGNIATVSPSNVTSDANGFALVKVFYPQEYAYWLEVTLEASTSVQGTEFSRQATFLLAGVDKDFNSPTVAPPGPFSPFGTGTACTDTL